MSLTLGSYSADVIYYSLHPVHHIHSNWYLDYEHKTRLNIKKVFILQNVFKKKSVQMEDFTKRLEQMWMKPPKQQQNKSKQLRKH